jgi:hypothetical protein
MTDSVSDTCSSPSTGSSLKKRTLVFSQEIGGYRYICNVDTNKNPFADCTNSIAKICNTTDPTWSSDSTKKDNCRNVVNTMFGQMNTYWQAVRRECGRWPFIQNDISYTGSPSSSTCATANTDLIEKAFYVLTDGTITSVHKGLPDSLMRQLWGNPLV